MATQALPGAGAFEWTLGDRLSKSRRAASLSRAQIAEHLSVSDQTVRNWESDAVEPRVSSIKAWAEMTGASLDWLITGENPPGPPPDDGGGPHGPGSPSARNSGPSLLVTSSKSTRREGNPPDCLPFANPGKRRPSAPSQLPLPPAPPAKRAA